MIKKIQTYVALLGCLSTLSMADNYSENLMVFTSNTMEKGCTSEPVVIYKGTKKEYAKFFKKELSELVEQSKANESGSIDKSPLLAGAALGAQGALNSISIGLGGSVLASGKDILGHGLAGMGVGILSMAILAGIDEGMMDYEYVYVTECNKDNSDRTRLITLVVSNDKLEEAKWIELAKEDQVKVSK